ncbi:peptide-methionine (S)-S-oxide reductase MsrA [Pseudomonas sp. F1_0610]|uniref:peptide-methionine (S)-S-oxide reductase MsrA n=1 Tax=Pseudomonas sp. F1_0610 TaxID=3114284 RepID=UPI0039C381AA
MSNTQFSELHLPTSEQALLGRKEPIIPSSPHVATGRNLVPPFPEQMQLIYFGLGCFWGAERLFWQLPGVWVTAVGYAGGLTPNPVYEEVCSGGTGHTEVVMVVFDPEVIEVYQLLACFWQSHNPTQGMRQGNDVGTQYRSTIYCANTEQLALAKSTANQFAQTLVKMGYGEITTEITMAPKFYYAEDYHQQYLAKNPNGYCGLKGTGCHL